MLPDGSVSSVGVATDLNQAEWEQEDIDVSKQVDVARAMWNTGSARKHYTDGEVSQILK